LAHVPTIIVVLLALIWSVGGIKTLTVTCRVVLPAGPVAVRRYVVFDCGNTTALLTKLLNVVAFDKTPGAILRVLRSPNATQSNVTDCPWIIVTIFVVLFTVKLALGGRYTIWP